MENYEPNYIYNHPDINSVSEYIKDKFYFAVLFADKYAPRKTTGMDFFSIDNELVYNNFFNDFGPLNLGCLYKYCWRVNKALKNAQKHHIKSMVVHYTVDNEKKKANAAFLIAAYSILYLKKTPKEAFAPLIDGRNLPTLPFQDASPGTSNYNIRLQDCLNALYKAASFGFFNFDDFNLSEYEKYEKLQNGDLNWIIPDKFIAFIGPSTQPGNTYLPPEHYYDYFLENNVSTVVRLNKPTYDAHRFTKIGIVHHEMYMPDGSVPSRKILNDFLHLSETASGPIAVHCKAGLGRTGTLICAFLIKHYKMSAKEAIAWARICRPGSVIGHQQAWLENMQKELWQNGHQYRLKEYGNSNQFPHHNHGIYSLARKLDARNRALLPNDHSIFRKCSQYMGSLTTNRRLRRHSTSNSGIISSLAKRLKRSEETAVEEPEGLSSEGERLNRIKVDRSRKKHELSAIN